MVHDLPEEIWCATWELLPLSARVAVSMTCRAWRAASVRHSHLWRELRIASPPPLHSPDLYADPYSGGNVVLLDETVAKAYVNRAEGIPDLAVTSLPSLQRILHRSGSHNLTIFIVLYRTVADSFLAALPDVLRPHSSRISRLSLFYVRPSACVALFNDLQPLIRLETLEYLSPYDDHHANSEGWNPRQQDQDADILDSRSLFASEPNVMLPALRTLKASWSFAWSGTHSNFQSLRRLDMYCIGPEIINPVLVACPALERLTIYLQYFRQGPGLDFIFGDTLATLVARIPSVHIKNAHPSHERDILRIFNSPTRRAYAVEHMDWSSVPPYEVSNVLADVRDAIHVSCALHIAGRAAVRCQDDDGKTRLLVAPSTNVAAVVERLHGLPLHALRTLSLHLTDVRHVFPLPQPAPCLERIEIWSDEYGDPALVHWLRDNMMAALERSRQSIPALDTLALRRRATEPAHMTATFINRLADALPSVRRVELWGFGILPDSGRVRSHVKVLSIDCVLPSDADRYSELLEL